MQKNENEKNKSELAKKEPKSALARGEEKILKFWQENNIFKKSLEKESPEGLPRAACPEQSRGESRGEFIFYDGPPFATGLPHYGSLLSSIIKDVIPRYKTMRGFHVRRRWGWDCHGLPIENMVEKELGLKSKKDIEKFGVEAFNKACRDSVLRYTREWKDIIDRVGRWVEFDNAYRTMDATYMESVWWALSNFYDKGLLYEGRKVLLYCPHCETPLAKAEVAMDNSYREITEESVVVKFKVKPGQRNPGLSIGHATVDENTYFLAWTTTPWTLPGNVALAVGDDIVYVVIKLQGEAEFVDGAVKEDSFYERERKNYFIVEKEALEQVGDGYRFKVDSNRPDALFWSIEQELRGKDLIGLEYEPLFDIPAVQATGKKAWYAIGADFVNTEEGTGIVHTAVIYGEDDFELGQKLDLPMVPLLDQSGHFNDAAPELIRGQYFKKAEKEIKRDLEERNLLFDKFDYTHSYPHCHRCDTLLYYNAISSWFINIQKIKPRMVELNEKINWFPEHLKHGRFLNNLESAPDWTISRNRYWASPLPIWVTNDRQLTTYDEGKMRDVVDTVVIGSLEELKKYTKKSGNKYFVMRHGEAEYNTKSVLNSDVSVENPLTSKGKGEVLSAVEELKKNDIDIVIHSPLQRTRETAELVAQELGLKGEILRSDDRLREVTFGEFEGKTIEGYHSFFRFARERLDKRPEGGEIWQEVKQRMTEVLYELEQKESGKNVLIISHNGPLQMIQAGARGLNIETCAECIKKNEFSISTAEVRELDFVPLPHNEDYELDLHRPYIDDLVLETQDGKELVRIPEVVDGWVESGSMPFAEYHYPFENKEIFQKRFPGDFIAEYIAQTRTWFYYMHAVSVGLFGSQSFKNVVTTGNILGRDGNKMSKSKGNYTDPQINIDKYGSDALRYYLMTSVVMQAEDVRFDDNELKEVHNRVINLLYNVVRFYELYAGEHSGDPSTTKGYGAGSPLDQWILARLEELVEEITLNLENYNTVKAGRPIREFIADFSQWYIRRSRERFKANSNPKDLNAQSGEAGPKGNTGEAGFRDVAQDKQAALSTTRFVLLELSKVMAPFMPFIAEEIYQKVKGTDAKESVHLENWPAFARATAGKPEILLQMETVRYIVSQALEQRATAGIKVRQPLSRLYLQLTTYNLQLGFLQLIKDEVNVKEIVEGDELKLDTTITPELEKEGQVRELTRAIQDLRKKQGLQPQDIVTLKVETSEGGREFVEEFQEDIKKTTGLGAIDFDKLSNGEDINVDNFKFRLLFDSSTSTSYKLPVRTDVHPGGQATS